MSNVLTVKLENFGPLDAEDRALLDSIAFGPREVAENQNLVLEGQPSDYVRLILEGFAYRFKILADRKRHIMAYLLPGDFCDLHVFILKAMDHNIGTLTKCQVVDIPRGKILELLERPNLARAVWWATLVDEATLREWLVNIGARSAEERVGHLLCELLLRLEAVGLTNGGHYELPITQKELGETMGLSSVHVNRVLQRLRAHNLITLKGKQLVILDAARLKRMSGFNPNYLHLNGGRVQRTHA